MVYHIFIGYDEREHEPFQVAKHSLLKHSKVPLKVHKLHHRDLRNSGLFNRPWTIDATGQYICQVDGKPFSTQFSHTRFLVPELWRNIPDANKDPLVMFVDCDFLWTYDIGVMFHEITQKRLRNNRSSPVYCVQHNYKPTGTVKMDGINQSDYNRKLWSAMMVFDMESEDNAHLIPELVNTANGRDLHNFCWVRDPNRVDYIDEGWHFVPNWSEKNTSKIYAIHYTEGGPWFDNYRNCRYSEIWWNYYNDYLMSKLQSVRFDVVGMIDG